jgi:hypothetical protein
MPATRLTPAPWVRDDTQGAEPSADHVHSTGRGGCALTAEPADAAPLPLTSGRTPEPWRILPSCLWAEGASSGNGLVSAAVMTVAVGDVAENRPDRRAVHRGGTAGGIRASRIGPFAARRTTPPRARAPLGGGAPRGAHGPGER